MKKKQGNSAGNKPAIDPNAWMVTFGDLIMLLLTFFVMLLTMKSMDSGALKERFQEFTPIDHTRHPYLQTVHGDIQQQSS